MTDDNATIKHAMRLIVNPQAAKFIRGDRAPALVKSTKYNFAGAAPAPTYDTERWPSAKRPASRPQSERGTRSDAESRKKRLQQLTSPPSLRSRQEASARGRDSAPLVKTQPRKHPHYWIPAGMLVRAPPERPDTSREPRTVHASQNPLRPRSAACPTATGSRQPLRPASALDQTSKRAPLRAGATKQRGVRHASARKLLATKVHAAHLTGRPAQACWRPPTSLSKPLAGSFAEDIPIPAPGFIPDDEDEEVQDGDVVVPKACVFQISVAIRCATASSAVSREDESR